MRGRLAAFLCAGLLGGCAGPVEAPVEPAPVSTATAAPAVAPARVARADGEADPDPMICRNVSPVGTRFVRRACMRKSAWDQAQRDGREATERVQRMATQMGNGAQ